jgi:hypothetical protein
MAASSSCRQCSASMWTTSTLESRCDWSSTPPTPAPAALILVEQLPRPCRYRLPLEPDSSCRAYGARSAFYSVGRGYDGAYGFLSVQPCRSVRFTFGGASAQGRYLASEGAHDVQRQPQEERPMKANPTTAPGRRRCMGCGHPLSEHLGHDECTVPKCPCHDFQTTRKA